MCTTPLASAAGFQIQYAHLISFNRHQLDVVIVANGCSCTQGLFKLPQRIALENQIEDVRFLFLPLLPTPPPKREYNAVSAVADEVWQYRAGGNLTTLWRKADREPVLAAKHTVSLLWYQAKVMYIVSALQGPLVAPQELNTPINIRICIVI